MPLRLLIIPAFFLISFVGGSLDSKPPPKKEKAKALVLSGKAAIQALEDANWSYDDTAPLGPKNWHLKYPTCGGRRQSPIAFYKEDIKVNPNLTDFEFEQYDTRISPGDLEVVNNGHTFEIDVKNADFSHIRIRGGGLPTWYQLVQFHFHWSHDDKVGSEHVVGDISEYPLVIHWVHTKEGMAITKALNQPDGLAVLAVTFELVHYRNQANTELDKITNHLSDVKFKNESAQIKESLILGNLFPQDRSNYFRYNGSLTTPPCSEAVIWTVFVNTVNATKIHLRQFRQLFSTGKNDNKIGYIDKNYRGVMPLNDRIVEVREEISDLGERSLAVQNQRIGRGEKLLILAGILAWVVGRNF